MRCRELLTGAAMALGLTVGLALGAMPLGPAAAQTQEAAATDTDAAAEAPTLLNEDELEVLVARIALYPDELIAVIVAASLEPLQVVQAQRFLENKKTKPDLKPDPKWDGSVISLLNYPEVLKMMNDDLDWVEALGQAVTNQEKDVLAAIQQLRDQAVASGVLKGNDKVVVEKANDKVIVKSKDPEVVYVPSYDPQILTDPGYVVSNVAEPIYYSDPYPSYYYPTAGYWAGAVTGALWAGAIDWDYDHFWGGDVDIDINDIDINNIDRVRNDFKAGKYGDRFDRDNARRHLEANDRNRIDRKGREAQRRSANANRPSERRDIRKSVESGLKEQRQGGDRARQADRRQGQAGERRQQRQAAQRADDRRPSASQAKRPQKSASKGASRSKPGNRVDNRPRNVSAMGDYGRGQSARNFSNRGHASRGAMRRPSGGGGGRRGGRR